MKKLLLVLSAMALGTGALMAQAVFKPGYYTTRDGQRVEGQVLIRNEFWKDNPKSFDFRTAEGAEAKAVDLSNVAELGIASGAVFRLTRVDLDRSTNDVGKLTQERNPEFKSETLFLRVVLKSKASLYEYEEGNLKRYFYSLDDGDIKQLVYKRYLNKNGEMLVNDTYKQQLFNELKCTSISMKDVENLKYELVTLTRFFTMFNDCSGSNVVEFKESTSGTLQLNLVFRPGLTQNSTLIENISIGGGGKADISGVTSYRIGLEAEGILPFGAGLWGLPVEVSYLTFSGSLGNASVNYKSVDLQAGVRRFFPTGKSSRLYLTGGILFSLPQNASMSVGTNVLSVDSSISATLAAGYRVNSLSFEFNYGTKRKIYQGNVYEATMSSYAFIVGYSFSLK